MARTLSIGTNSYLFPDQSNNPIDSFWGENVTNWATDVTAQINSFSILLPEAQQTLNNSSVNAAISLLTFDPTLFRRVEVEFALVRDAVRETGYMTLISNGASWDHNLEYDSPTPSDIVLGVVGSTVVYSSDVVVGESNIRFRATGISS